MPDDNKVKCRVCYGKGYCQTNYGDYECVICGGTGKYFLESQRCKNCGYPYSR